ncbi:MAG: aminomethyl-transferring glycine dehydrogenase subunit GcvPB [Lachnospiraceae bacterium]
MDLLFEKSIEGRKLELLADCDVPIVPISAERKRDSTCGLPQLGENDISRHYTQLMKRTHGVNDGFYPLGSCTMKYNPKIAETIAGMEGFTDIHPLQPERTTQGCFEVLNLAERYLCEITGMEAMSMQPAAGAHGEFAGLLMMKAYHQNRGESRRTKILIPDSAHGTNPASSAMAGFEVVTIPSAADGGVDVEKLRAAADEDTAGLMLTNPNTLGIFDPNILKITAIIHECGGLNYYDGANLNAIVGMTRPGDMGFDIIHLNLHKTFATPHGGGGPGSGPVGCRAFLKTFLPSPVIQEDSEGFHTQQYEESIGRLRSFHGNFLVVVRALSYILTLGEAGIRQISRQAVLHANYMMEQLKDIYQVAYPGRCMHEFVLTLEELKKETGISALDIAKGMLDYGIHPPTMYFPISVKEALMIEPTETESKETLDEAVNILRELYQKANEDPQALKEAPLHTPVGRLDELGAARKPVVKFCES